MFVTRGYHAVTLEQIADEAGASQGVVSRFDSKADMFLALLADRITERAAQNASAAGQLAGSGLSAALLELAWQAERATPDWRLLVTEFRVHAARDPEHSRRYAAAHASTVDEVASALASVAVRNAQTLALPARQKLSCCWPSKRGLPSSSWPTRTPSASCSCRPCLVSSPHCPPGHPHPARYPN